MKVYFISGLGADRRAFQRLTLPPAFEAIYLDWITPQPKESLTSYAQRMGTSINTHEPFAIIGLSFGGMIATELARQLQPVHTILISSISSAAQLPPFLKMASTVRLHRWLPRRLLSHPSALSFWLFGAKSPTEKKLLSHIIFDTDPDFIRWAFDAIAHWKREPPPPHLFHIHGSRDKILPLRFTRPDVVVRGGSHFMVWTKAGEISKLIASVLQDQSQL